MYYLDTSVIVPFYVPEKISAKIDQFITQHNELSISDLSEVEFVSAVSKKVRIKEMPLGDAKRITDLFQSHIHESYYYKFTLEPAHFETASELLIRFDLTLNTLDALHLSIVMLGNPTFVTSDKSLFKTANTLGIPALHI